MNFAHPIFLLLFLLLPVVAWRLWARRKNRATVRYSDVSRVKQVRPSFMQRVRPMLPILRLLVLSFLILALARPRTYEDQITPRYTEGVDIMMALDVSSSMLAEDLALPEYSTQRDLLRKMQAQRYPTRLDVAKNVVKDFVDERQNDRIGLVVFARDSFIRCPMTLDYDMLKSFVSDVEILMDRQMEDGTAIAMSIANCVSRLRQSKAASRVLVFLTDGEETVPGEIDQITAAELAKAMGIRIYTVGVGTEGLAPVRVRHPFFGEQVQLDETKIDEETLQKIADITGGQYFRALDREGLGEVFDSINELEKTEIESQGTRVYHELFPWFVIPALGLLLIEQILVHTRFRTLP